MARRVFFSFHYDIDIWRANQVRNSNVVVGPDVAGFFDHSEYESAMQSGDDGIRRMILSHLNNTTVTVVLIGTETANRPWVKYEIEESIKRNNGLLGICIHHLRDHGGQVSARGNKPSVPWHVQFPAYNWDWDLDKFRTQIEAAGRRSDFLKSR